MGQKDLTEKNLEFYPDVFADVCNALLYEGEDVIKEEDLQPAPTETLYHSGKGGMRNQFHDVSKYEMQDGHISVQYTLENETKAKRRMVLRKAGYEGAVYREQLDKREVYPVVGAVLYWGRKRWRAPNSIYQLFGGRLTQKKVSKYVDDIKLHVFEMAHLPKEVRVRFKSDMRIVVDCLAEWSDFMPPRRRVKHPEALFLLLETLTGDVRYGEMIAEALELEQKEEEVIMCEFLDKYLNDGIERGKKQGEEKARLEDIKNLIEKLKLTAEQAMEILEIPKEEQEKYLRTILI